MGLGLAMPMRCNNGLTLNIASTQAHAALHLCRRQSGIHIPIYGLFLNIASMEAAVLHGRGSIAATILYFSIASTTQPHVALHPCGRRHHP